MDLFGLGIGEIILILLISMILLGPARIVSISRSLGKLTRTLKKAASDLTSQITDETEDNANKHPPAT